MDIRERLGAVRLRAELGRHRHDRGPICRCGAVRDPAVTKKGRNAGRRGKDYERSVAARLGLRRVGQYGGPDDVRGDWASIQCKVGGAFPELLWRWLQAIPHDADRIRAVVVGDSPGPGGRRREVIVMDLSEFAARYAPIDEQVTEGLLSGVGGLVRPLSRPADLAQSHTGPPAQEGD